MNPMADVHRAAMIRAELRRLRRDLDKVEARRTKLFARRLTLWREARALDVAAVDLASESGVSAVTVRQLIRRDGEG